MSQPRLSRAKLRPYLETIEALGITVEGTVVRGSGHVGYKLRHGQKAGVFIGPSSSSDWRTVRNFRSDVRRWRDN